MTAAAWLLATVTLTTTAAAVTGWVAWWRMRRDYNRDVSLMVRVYAWHVMPEGWQDRPDLHVIDGGRR